MNSQKLSRLSLGVFTTAVSLTLLLASAPNQPQTNGASVQPQLADGSGPVPRPAQSQIVLLADGSGPVPPPKQLLADGSGPVPPPKQLLADGSGPVPPPKQLLADGSGPVPPPSPSGRSLAA
jgi:hypothetical protein